MESRDLKPSGGLGNENLRRRKQQSRAQREPDHGLPKKTEES